MCINSVAISVVPSIYFSLIFSYEIATSYHSNLRFFLVVNEIKFNYFGNNVKLKSRCSFRRNNSPLSRIICRRPVIKRYGFLYIPKVLETSLRNTHFFCLFSKHQGKYFLAR